MEDKKQKDGHILFREKRYDRMDIISASKKIKESIEGIEGTIGVMTDNPACYLAALIGIANAKCQSFELNPCDGIAYNQGLVARKQLAAIVTDQKSQLEGAIELDSSIWEKTSSDSVCQETELRLVREQSDKIKEPNMLTEKELKNCLHFGTDILKRNLQHTIYIHEKTELWNPVVLYSMMEEECCIEIIETKREEKSTFAQLKDKDYTCLYVSLAQFYAWKFWIITEENLSQTMHDIITYGNELYDICSIKEYFNHQGIKWYHFMGSGCFQAVSAIKKEDTGELYHLIKEIKGCPVKITNRVGKDMPAGTPGSLSVCTDGNHQTVFMGKRLKDGKIKITGGSADCCHFEGRFCSFAYIEQKIKQILPITKTKMQFVNNKLVLFYAAEKQIEESQLVEFVHTYVPDFYPELEWNETTEDTLVQNSFRILLKRRKKRKKKENQPFVMSEQQEEILNIWKNILGTADIDVDDNFFDIGGNSALFVQMLGEVTEKVQKELPMMKVMKHSTLRNLFAILEQDTVIEDVSLKEIVYEDIQAESYLTNLKDAAPAVKTYQNILLTGASGFLGCFLLKELLEQTSATIYCLIRGKDEQQAYQKLFDAMCYYKLDGSLQYKRIRLVVGDFGKDKFGLSSEQYTQLCRSVDLIIHSGAEVNFVYNYEMLKNENVIGTGRILEFASTIKVKPVHFISSMAIFGVGAKATEVDEEYQLELSDLPRSGYNQTKWAADYLVSNARTLGLPCSIYRIGNVCGDSVNGICQTRDFIWMLFKVGIEMNVFAEYYRLPFAMTTVDSVANSVVRIALEGDTAGTYHVMSERSVIYQQLLEWIRSYGFEFSMIGFQDWIEMVRKYTRTLGDAKFQSIPTVIGVKEDVADDFQFISYNNKKTLEKVHQLGGSILPLNEEVFHKHLSQFLQSGFIKEKN